MANSKDNISKYATSFIGFDESSGNVYDSIGGYVGTTYNAPTRVVGWNGEGYAMSFNGSNQRVVFNSDIIPLGAFSIHFRIKHFGSSNYNMIFSNGGYSAQYGISLQITPQGYLEFYGTKGTSGANNFVLNSSIPINDSQWHEIFLTWDGTTNANAVKMYVDNMVTPNATGTAIIDNNVLGTYNLRIGSSAKDDVYFLYGQIDHFAIYDRVISPIPDKYLVLHSSQYKYHDGTSWQTTTNTEADFIQYGMNDLSHISQAQWNALPGSKSLVVWSDFEDKQYVSAVLEKEPFTPKDLLGNTPQLVYYTDSNAEQVVIKTETDPFSVYDYIGELPQVDVYTESTDNILVSTTTDPFSVYDYISETPVVVAYTESTDDIIVTTATDPYDLYQEFGDSMEVLFYTDDEAVNAADLIINANWTPIDELAGDFEVVTWTDESPDTAQRVLEMNALPQPQIIRTEINKIINQLYAIQAEVINENPFSSVKFLFSYTPGVYLTWYEGKPYTFTGAENAWKLALTAEQVAALSESEIQKLISGDYEIVILVDQYIRDYTGPVVNTIAVTQDVPITSPTVESLDLEIVKSLLVLDLDFRISILSGDIKDPDGGEFKYRLVLNGVQIFPTDLTKNWSEWVKAPYNVYTQLLSSQIKVGAQNTLVIHTENRFGDKKDQEFLFEGEYSGLLFKDPMTGYYTTDVGDILQYLLAGTLQQGQTSPEYEVYLINNNPFAVNNIVLVGTANSEGVTVELSKANPFVNETVITWPEIMEYKDIKIFHLRLRVEKDAVITQDGMFTVTAAADIVE